MHSRSVLRLFAAKTFRRAMPNRHCEFEPLNFHKCWRTNFAWLPLGRGGFMRTRGPENHWAELPPQTPQQCITQLFEFFNVQQNTDSREHRSARRHRHEQRGNLGEKRLMLPVS